MKKGNFWAALVMIDSLDHFLGYIEWRLVRDFLVLGTTASFLEMGLGTEVVHSIFPVRGSSSASAGQVQQI